MKTLNDLLAHPEILFQAFEKSTLLKNPQQAMACLNLIYNPPYAEIVDVSVSPKLNHDSNLQRRLKVNSTIKKILNLRNEKDETLLVKTWNYDTMLAPQVLYNLNYLYYDYHNYDCLQASTKINRHMVYDNIESNTNAALSDILCSHHSKIYSEKERVNWIETIRYHLLNYLRTENKDDKEQLNHHMIKCASPHFSMLKPKVSDSWFLLAPFINIFSQVSTLIDELTNEHMEKNIIKTDMLTHTLGVKKTIRNQICSRLNEMIYQIPLDESKKINYMIQSVLSVAEMSYAKEWNDDYSLVFFLKKEILKQYLMKEKPGLIEQLNYIDLQSKLSLSPTILNKSKI